VAFAGFSPEKGLLCAVNPRNQMGVLDSVQDVIVELAGVIVFLVGVW
jgi:hypothetical protein